MDNSFELVSAVCWSSKRPIIAWWFTMIHHYLRLSKLLIPCIKHQWTWSCLIMHQQKQWHCLLSPQRFIDQLIYSLNNQFFMIKHISTIWKGGLGWFISWISWIISNSGCCLLVAVFFTPKKRLARHFHHPVWFFKQYVKALIKQVFGPRPYRAFEWK